MSMYPVAGLSLLLAARSGDVSFYLEFTSWSPASLRVAELATQIWLLKESYGLRAANIDVGRSNNQVVCAQSWRNDLVVLI